MQLHRLSVGVGRARRIRAEETVTVHDMIKLLKRRRPSDLSIALRTEGTTVQFCGDNNVAGTCFSGHYAMGKVQMENRAYSKKNNVAFVV